MTLNKLIESLDCINYKRGIVGVREYNSMIIVPEYVDELLETHGDQEVDDPEFSEDGILIITFKEGGC